MAWNLFSAPTVHANGGGYFTRGVDQTGTIQSFQPEGTEQVAIVQEDLYLELRAQTMTNK